MSGQESFDFDAASAPAREFLGWDAPLLESVTRWLLADNRRSHLASTMVVVPTSNSGRRLRMALSGNGGVLSPYVFTPGRLYEVDGAATPQQVLWAWVQVIRGLKVAHFPHLLPNHDKESFTSFSAALAIARQLSSLRDMLADGDSSFRDAQFHSPEKERWEELMAVETKMLTLLGKWGLRDPVLAKRELAKSPEIPPGVERIVVACVPDPTLLARQSLQALLDRGYPVTVLVHAPARLGDSFDAWGVPLAEKWSKMPVDIPDWRERMHVCGSATEAAGQCVKVLADTRTESEQAVLALCDPSLSGALEKTFSDHAWPLFNPENTGAGDTGMVRFLRAMRDLVGWDATFSALLEVVRQPCGQVFLPEKTDRYHAARLMDGLHQDHLPETLADAMALADEREKKILESVDEKLREITSGKPSETLAPWLADCLAYAGQEEAAALVPALAESLEAVEKLEQCGDQPEVSEVLEMMLESVSSAKTPDDRGDSVLDLQGWSEVPYDPAPHLILAGMHEECVPGGNRDDMFVPDSLRKKLDLRDATDRFARDAYLLSSAVESRRKHGRVDVMVAQFNDAGEARKPSRLLMRQEGAELAAVVSYLFAEPDSAGERGGAWTRDWQLRLQESPNPYADDPPRSVSPSAIRDYLDCPFRFYLKRIPGMQAYEADKRELNAMDFGNICHRVVDAFAKDASICNSRDEKEIFSAFDELLVQVMAATYGNNQSLPLTVQMESARERLRALAKAQAARAEQGWRIVASEFDVGKDGVAWDINGHPVKMTIDRIDRNEDGNRWCVWDYKTSGKAKEPPKVHLVPWKEEENRPLLGELLPMGRKKSNHRWADVQLPLYADFVRQHFKTGDLPEVGYINLPRAVDEVGFKSWKGFDEETCGQALEWASAAVSCICEGVFAPPAIYPAAKRNWDDFHALAPDGLAAAFGLADHPAE